jgi:hypothetical protein
MRRWHPHALLSAAYLLTRLVLYLRGLRFEFALDWMWMADPLDLATRLGETLFYFHAFPPGINALTGLLLKTGEHVAPLAAQLVFLAAGVLLVNLVYLLARAVGLRVAWAAAFALAFSLAPPTIYFEHLFHYEWPVITLLCLVAVLFHRGIAAPSAAIWFGCFAAAAAVTLTRSTFHLVWLIAVVALAVALVPSHARRAVLAASLVPLILTLALYTKNAIIFGEFAASTFGPASLTLVTVDRMPPQQRVAWMHTGQLSAFAMVSVYAAPRAYSPFFASPAHPGWPPQLTRLEHQALPVPNFNHWWLLDVHRARRADVWHYLRARPLDYVRHVAVGVRDLFGPTTTWHPRDGTPHSPHASHRQVLGGYERVFNGIMHGWPLAPFGLYMFLPVPLIWACVHARRHWKDDNAAVRGRAALLVFCVFQIVYVIAASSMLTYLEMPRYRFQVEWAIWVVSAAAITQIFCRLRR